MASASVAIKALQRGAAKTHALPASSSATWARGFAAGKKKSAAKKSGKKSGKKGGEDANFEHLLRTLRGRYPDAEPWTEEDKARHAEIARRYNRMSSIRHNHYMRDLQTKIDLKWAAINALPAELQLEALEIDDEPIPEERGFPTWTPPIEGFFRYSGEDGESEDDF